MKIDFRNPILKKVGLTLFFYFVYGIAIYLLEKVMPSGAHTPGLGLLAFILLPIVSLVLFIINLSKTYKGDKAYKFSALVHLLFIIGFLIFLKVA